MNNEKPLACYDWCPIETWSIGILPNISSKLYMYCKVLRTMEKIL